MRAGKAGPRSRSSALNMDREGTRRGEGEGDRQATGFDADSQSVCVSDGGLTEMISGAAALKASRCHGSTIQFPT